MKTSFLDGFVKSPISALRFISLSLRRTASTPHSTGFARLELGLFTKPSVVMTFYESIKIDGFQRSSFWHVWERDLSAMIVGG
ncbi:MAG: hypothetical protein Q7U75_13915, partial [Desulfobacterales bacterium]|nr:hypothetical protein [Desulfobacterales bacterium]